MIYTPLRYDITGQRAAFVWKRFPDNKNAFGNKPVQGFHPVPRKTELERFSAKFLPAVFWRGFFYLLIRHGFTPVAVFFDLMRLV
jgi:hypothetical protein